jgi:hypothetical protein
MSRYACAARPAGLAVLRIGERAISARFERQCSVRCVSRLTILTKPWTAADSSFARTELHGHSIRRGKESRLQIDGFQMLPGPPVRAAIRPAVPRWDRPTLRIGVGLSHSLQFPDRASSPAISGNYTPVRKHIRTTHG